MRDKERCHGCIILIVLIGFMWAGGCSGRSLNARQEPEILVVRNISGQHITSFTLAVATSNSHSARRYGTIAPVPMGASQVYVRPSSAPRLPDIIVVQWLTMDGKTHERTVSLKHALNQMQRETKNALVFEILLDERINVYLDKYKEVP